MPNSSAATRTEWLGVILISLCLCVVTVATFGIQLVDDAYITFRTVENLSVGQGLVFNPGERIETTTSLLWPLLLTPFTLAGLPLKWVASYLGLLFGLLALVEMYRTGRRIGLSGPTGLVMLIIIGSVPSYWLTVSNGMEGGLFALLLICTLQAVLRNDRWVWTAGLWGTLMFLTRPETVLLLPIFVIFLHWSEKHTVQKAGIAPLLLMWGGAVVLTTLFRLVYYGDFLPNSIVAKHLPLFGHVYGHWVGLYLAKIGMEYVALFTVTLPHLALAPLVALILLQRHRVAQLCFAIVAIQSLIVLRNGGDWMPNLRLFMYYLPVFGISLGLCIARLAGESKRNAHPSKGTITIITCVCVGITALTSLKINRTETSFGVPATAEPQWQVLAETLKPVLGPDDLVAPEAMGVFAWVLSDVPVHDFLGLANRYIARNGTRYQPTYGKSDYAYSVEQAPTLFVFQSGDYHPDFIRADTNGRFEANYIKFDLQVMKPGFSVFIRQDAADCILPALKSLRHRLQADSPG